MIVKHVLLLRQLCSWEAFRSYLINNMHAVKALLSSAIPQEVFSVCFFPKVLLRNRQWASLILQLC